jgi:peptidoglycan hydrolase CwlO-like protein
LVLLSLQLVAAPVGADTKQELDAAKKKLDRLIDQIVVETALVEDLETRASVVAGQISELTSRIQRVQSRVVGLQQEIREIAAQILQRQQELDRRAWVAYENGPGSNIAFILGATSLSDLTLRLEIVDRAAELDQDLIEDLEARKERLASRRAELERLQVQLAAEEAALEEQRRILDGQLSAARTVVLDLEQHKAEAAKLVRELEAKRQRELEAERLRQAQLAAELAAQLATQQAVGASISGVLQVCPVDEPHAYSNDYGAPRYTGGFHPHAGNDIFAPQGTPIRAPFPGRAEDATNAIGGLAVKVFGAEGYVYNAHLSGFGTLGPVQTGDIIGFVGSTGNAQGTSPHDHFEWHPGNGPDVNPFPYLNSVC